jgi:hypothetical protein
MCSNLCRPDLRFSDDTVPCSPPPPLALRLADFEPSHRNNPPCERRGYEDTQAWVSTAEKQPDYNHIRSRILWKRRCSECLSAQIRKSQTDSCLFRREQSEGQRRGLVRCSCLGNRGTKCGRKKSPVWKGTSPSSSPTKATSCLHRSLIVRNGTFRAARSNWATAPHFFA